MVLRMTVNDSDYTELLENFAKTLISIPTIDRDRIYDLDKKYRNLLMKDVLIKEETEFVIGIITEGWQQIISEEDYDYLTKNFECMIVDTVETKNRNGEVVYFFPMSRSGKIVTL